MIGVLNADDRLYGMAGGGDQRSDIDVKASVRKRDGNKCRDCGMTSEQHFDEYERELEVHRLLPGVNYNENFCVTLCRACHAKKPRRDGDSFWKGELRWFAFNMYNSQDGELYDALCCQAISEGIDTSELITRILQDHFSDVLKHAREDLVSQADGLW